MARLSLRRAHMSGREFALGSRRSVPALGRATTTPAGPSTSTPPSAPTPARSCRSASSGRNWESPSSSPPRTPSAGPREPVTRESLPSRSRIALLGDDDLLCSVALRAKEGYGRRETDLVLELAKFAGRPRSSFTREDLDAYVKENVEAVRTTVLCAHCGSRLRSIRYLCVSRRCRMRR